MRLNLILLLNLNFSTSTKNKKTYSFSPPCTQHPLRSKENSLMKQAKQNSTLLNDSIPLAEPKFKRLKKRTPTKKKREQGRAPRILTFQSVHEPHRKFLYHFILNAADTKPSKVQSRHTKADPRRSDSRSNTSNKPERHVNRV